MTGQSNRTPSGQGQPAAGNRPAGRRGVRAWLAETPDAGAAPATPASMPAPVDAEPVTDSGRPRKAERRKARQKQFFAARRGEAATARARFEVAADHLRAVGTERDLADAADAVERIAGRRA